MAVDLILNGKPTRLDVLEGMRLLDALREQGHLTGAKEGCGEGECGACTVLLEGEPVCACLLFVGQAAGLRVETIEGVAAAHEPLTTAIVEAAGVQCGFCTPGIVLSAKALLDANPHPSRQEIQVALSGNLCRCTGYHRILDAVERASAAPAKRRGRR